MKIFHYESSAEAAQKSPLPVITSPYARGNNHEGAHEQGNKGIRDSRFRFTPKSGLLV
jgi:hypothetical protein